jgi:hypothetical protein
MGAPSKFLTDTSSSKIVGTSWLYPLRFRASSFPAIEDMSKFRNRSKVDKTPISEIKNLIPQFRGKYTL